MKEPKIGYILKDHDPEGFGWFSGWSKYAGMFNRTWSERCAKVFATKEEAESVQKILNENYHWNFALVSVVRYDEVKRWTKDDSGVVVCPVCKTWHDWVDYRAKYCDHCGERLLPEEGYKEDDLND